MAKLELPRPKTQTSVWICHFKVAWDHFYLTYI